MRLPNKTRRAAMILSLLMTTSGSLVYLAAAHRSVDYNDVAVPETRYEKPASVTDTVPRVDGRLASPTVPTVVSKATKDVPVEALSAYRRAAVLVNQASQCEITWSLLAAIGRIESD